MERGAGGRPVRYARPAAPRAVFAKAPFFARRQHRGVRVGARTKGHATIPDRQKLYIEIRKNTIICRAHIAFPASRLALGSDRPMASDAKPTGAASERETPGCAAHRAGLAERVIGEFIRRRRNPLGIASRSDLNELSVKQRFDGNLSLRSFHIKSTCWIKDIIIHESRRSTGRGCGIPLHGLSSRDNIRGNDEART